jgi:molecular chaperone GrpE
MKKRKQRQAERMAKRTAAQTPTPAEQERRKHNMTENERFPNEEFPENIAEMPEEIPGAGTVEEPAEEQTQEKAADAQEEAAKAELEAAKAQAQEYLTLAQRVQADFDNFRKRNASVRADSFEEGRREVAGQMLPVLDNLERALESAAEDSPLKSGLELTLRQMREVYGKLGVEAIDRKGEKFDPNLENAVMQAPADAGEPGTVAQVFQKGYTMGGHVLRHAMVQVVEE